MNAQVDIKTEQAASEDRRVSEIVTKLAAGPLDERRIRIALQLAYTYGWADCTDRWTRAR